MQLLSWTGCWVLAGGSGNPFRWTVSVNGLGGRDVVAEASLAKVEAQSRGRDYAKATVLTASNTSNLSYNWGIDGAPMRYLSKCTYMSFALEVSGPSTYAWMNGKIYAY